MNYRKFIIRFKDGIERCIVANDINFDLQNLRASIWVGYSYRVLRENGVLECHKDVDRTNIDLSKVQYIAELRERYARYDEIIYIYGREGSDTHD